MHLVAFGPGFGESLVVVVPPGEWIVVDSLRRRSGDAEQIPAVDMLDGFGASAAAIILTHPHLDHADGIPALVGRRRAGGFVGCLPSYLEPPEKWRGQPDGQEELRRSATEAALQAVFDAWERDPASRWELHAGSSQSIGDAEVEVLHPPAKRVPALLKNGDLNALSAPLLIRWRDARLVLGADLTWPEWDRFARSAACAM